MDTNEKDALCSAISVHPDAIESAREALSEDETLLDMSEFFRVFDDPTRLKIINALMAAELCVCDLATLIGMSQPAVSHHLQILRQARVIRFRRAGKCVYYSLCDDHIALIFRKGLAHISELNRPSR